MVKLDKTVVAESQQLVKHILDKDYDDWELEELPFIKNFVDTEWSNDLMTKVMWSQFVAEGGSRLRSNLVVILHSPIDIFLA